MNKLRCFACFCPLRPSLGGLMLGIMMSLLICVTAEANSVGGKFLVRRVHVQGTHSIEEATVAHYLKVKPGQYFNLKQAQATIKRLYASGLFEQVQLSRRGNDLIVVVVERPVIYRAQVSGNKKVTDTSIDPLLKQFGLTGGDFYNPASVHHFKQALLAVYKENSLSDAHVVVEVTPQSYHRVGLDIQIQEGHFAHIRSIRFTGRPSFSTRRLLWVMGLSQQHWWTAITHSDRYTKKALEDSLERLRAFYLDKGYADFHVQPEIRFKDNGRSVYLVLKLKEGSIYRIGGIKLTGKWGEHLSEAQKIVRIKPGQIAAKKALIVQQQRLGSWLASRGYALSHVQLLTKQRPKQGLLDVRFHSVPGAVVYVRQVRFSGNHKTADYVLRREMKQQEGQPFSLAKVQESKRRLANLRYLENIQIKPVPVPGKPDQIDLIYEMKEGSSASANFQLGYSDIEGLLYGIFFNQLNFLGTGRSLSISFDHSEYARNYSFVYNNPYYTASGISRGFHLYSEHVTSNRANISDYKSHIYGGGVHYKIPLGHYQQLGLGYGYEHTRLYAGHTASDEVNSFIEQHGHQFDQFKIRFGWYFGNYDRGIFPTRGMHHHLSTELGLPFNRNSIDYYKLAYEGTFYKPLAYHWIVAIHGKLGYGRGYGNTGNALPFFKRFYAGGIGSVRGYEGNSLGPRDSSGRAVGGNVLTIASLNLILPPFLGDKVRTALFLDAGNVGVNRFGSLKYSVGLSIRWHTIMAPLVFSFAEGLNTRGTKRELFQFTLGGSI